MICSSVKLDRFMSFLLCPRKIDRTKLEFSAKLGPAGMTSEAMKASKFSDAQKAFVLKQGKEGTLVAEIYLKPHCTATSLRLKT